MGEYYYHYTSRHAGQEIIIANRLRPGPSGRIYLTQRTYERGADAANHLSILGKPVEIVLAISVERVADPSEERHVDPIIGEDGIEIRSGRGTEIFTEQEIDCTSLAWWALSLP